MAVPCICPGTRTYAIARPPAGAFLCAPLLLCRNGSTVTVTAFSAGELGSPRDLDVDLSRACYSVLHPRETMTITSMLPSVPLSRLSLIALQRAGEEALHIFAFLWDAGREEYEILAAPHLYLRDAQTGQLSKSSEPLSLSLSLERTDVLSVPPWCASVKLHIQARGQSWSVASGRQRELDAWLLDTGALASSP